MPRVVSSCTAGCLPSARAHGRSLLLRGTLPPLLVRVRALAHSARLRYECACCAAQICALGPCSPPSENLAATL